MPWNRNHIVGQKPPLKPHEVWSIRARLEVSSAIRDLALFDLATHSELRGCDLVAISVGDIAISVLAEAVEQEQIEEAPHCWGSIPCMR